jgi:DMSO/TMAO reductase YedYZ heme-binding membrane subunit
MKVTFSILFFIVFVVIIAVPPVILQYTGNTGLITAQFWTVFFFMAGITFLILLIMLIAGSKNQEYLTPAFLGGTTLKLLACLIFIFVFLHKNPSHKVVFLGDFLYAYLLNTVFEVYILLRNLRHENLR